MFWPGRNTLRPDLQEGGSRESRLDTVLDPQGRLSRHLPQSRSTGAPADAHGLEQESRESECPEPCSRKGTLWGRPEGGLAGSSRSVSVGWGGYPAARFFSPFGEYLTSQREGHMSCWPWTRLPSPRGFAARRTTQMGLLRGGHANIGHWPRSLGSFL